MSFIYHKMFKLMEAYENQPWNDLHAITSNPETSPAKLAEIHKDIFDKEEEIEEKHKNNETDLENVVTLKKFHQPYKENLAQNPNTPPNVLWHLGSEGHQIFKNPIMPLLQLEDPTFSNVNAYHLKRTIQQAYDIPDEYAKTLANHPDPSIPSALIKNDNINPNIVHQTRKHSSSSVREKSAMYGSSDVISKMLHDPHQDDVDENDSLSDDVYPFMTLNPAIYKDPNNFTVLAGRGKDKTISNLLHRIDLSNYPKAKESLVNNPNLDPFQANKWVKKDSHLDSDILDKILDINNNHLKNNPQDINYIKEYLSNIFYHSNADEDIKSKAENIYKQFKNNL